MDSHSAAADDSQTEKLVELLFDLAERIRTHSETISAAFDLTPSQAAALLRLDKSIPMNELAGALTCDASNVTGIVDRLERRDLVQRHTDDSDRRIKNLVLTPAGCKLRRQLHERLYADLPTAAGLMKDLGTLAELLQAIDTPA